MLKKALLLSSVFVLLFAVLATTNAFGTTYTTVSLGSYYNETFSYVHGATPPGTLSGVPFYFGDGNSFYAGGQDWHGYHSNTGISNITLTTDVAGADTAYLLINTVWGIPGFKAGKVQFTWAGGGTYGFDLILGDNIRDWHGGPYENMVTASNSKPVFSYYPDHWAGSSRIDMLTVSLPGSYRNDRLVSVGFTDYGDTDVSRLLIEGVTVRSNPVPIPAGLFLFAPGLLGLAAARRKLKR